MSRVVFDHVEAFGMEPSVSSCEHFRCMLEIIRFSNDLCYSDTPLIPLRQNMARTACLRLSISL